MVGELEKERRGDASLFMLVGTCTQGRGAIIFLSNVLADEVRFLSRHVILCRSSDMADDFS